jgi:hypothetical protein
MTPQIMTETIHYIPVKKTWCHECQEHKPIPKVPYTHTKKTYDMCCIQTAKNHTSNDVCYQCFSEFSVCCCPCALALDIVCCIPMIFGYYTVNPPKK